MLSLTPITFAQAVAYVNVMHRHHKAPIGMKYAIGAKSEDGLIVGVCIVGRPIARNADDGYTVEVVRLATNGHPNACSLLYGAAWRAGKALGYRHIITYILESEPGTSLRAAGWVCINESTGGGSWSRDSRVREDKHPTCKKQKWEKRL